MKCPKCGNKMFKNNKVWECSKCGCTQVKNNDNLFTKLNVRDISNKINGYRENNDVVDKIIGGIGNVTEQVSIQAKKEQAYIKSRNNNDSTELFDDNEFFISKVVLDGVDFVSAKKQENEKSVNDEKTAEEETEIKPVNKFEDEKLNEKTSIKQMGEIYYSNLNLSDLQESLIKSLPIITNPSEYEENIIKKYSEYNSNERKELLKDCWTVTKLAEEHNINRQEVQKAILTDEFLDKDLIGVFKVNPDNIRSLKILYRKLLTENQSIDANVVSEVKSEHNNHIEKSDETSQEKTNNNSTNIIQKNKKQNKSEKRGLFSRKSPEQKEFEKN